MAVKKDNVIGFAMQLDVTDLKAGLQETKKAITTANKQFNASVAGMDNWQDSVDGVSAKLKQLDTTLLHQKKNLAGYEAELEKAKEEYGENSEQVRRYQDKILDCQAAIGKTEKAQRKYTEQLSKVQSEHASTITDIDELKGVLSELDTQLDKDKKAVSDYEAALEDAKKEHGDASEEVNDLVKKLTEAKRAVSNTESAQKAYSDQLNRVESETNDVTTDTKKLTNAMKDADSTTVSLKGGFTVLKATIADLASNAIQALIGGLKNAITESREFRQEMSFLKTSADDSGASFEAVQENVKDVYSVFGETDSAVEGMNNLMAAGFLDKKNLDQITDQLIGASIKWKDTLKFEGLADGLQETLATGKAVGPFAELLERGGVNLEKFDDGLAKCKTDAEKQNYVLQKLNKLGLADVTKGYRDSNKELIEGAEAQFEYEQAMANFGAKAEPVLTTIKKGVVDVLNAFMDLFQDVDLEGLKSRIQGAFQWFIDEAVPAIKKAIDFVVDNKDVILALIAGIGSGMAAWKITSIMTSVVDWVKKAVVATKAWMVATEGMTVAQRLLNLAQKANVIGIVITAIAALVAAFIVLWKKCDWFREFWINLWNKIKEIAEKVWVAIKDFCLMAWDKIKEIWAVAVEWFKAIWEGIKAVFMGVVTFYATVYGNAWKAIKKAWSSVVNWFKDIWNKIKKVFSSVATWYKQQFTTAWNGIRNAWSSVVTWFRNIWNNIKSVFSAVGSWFRQQFTTAWNNIKSAWSSVGSFFSGIWSKIKSAFSSVGSTLGGYFNTAWSNIKSAFGSVGSFFSGIVEKIKSAFSGIKKKFKSIGKNIMDGIKEGVNSKIKSIKKAVTDGVEKAVNGVKSFLGIKSPSRLMRDEVGKMMGLGVGEGILASSGTVLKDAIKFSDKIVNGLSSNISGITMGLNSSAGVMRSMAVPGQNVTNVTTYNQTINSPKALDRKTIYRNSKNLLNNKQMSPGATGGQ